MIPVLRARDQHVAYALMQRPDPIPELKRSAASALAKRVSGWTSYLVRTGARVEVRVTDGGLRGASHAQLVDGD
jgi:hypothetical protein